MQLLYLSRADVEKIALPMREVIAALEEMFREKGQGRVEMPPKPGIHPLPDAFIHAMPASLPGIGTAGMKWVSGFPRNQERGLPYISGLLILNDPETGIPIAVMDCTWITAMRTGAATAVAAKYLARRDSSTVGIIACGVQGRSNLEALACEFDLGKVWAYDIHSKVARTFADEMAEALGLEIEVVASAKQAVVEADLVVTSGPILKNPTPTIERGWLRSGCFGSAVDFDSYWQGPALREADKIVTDDIPQMEHYRDVGYFKETPKAHCGLAEVVCGKKPGREREDERIIAINLGIAPDDMATAIRIYERARKTGVGTSLPL